MPCKKGFLDVYRHYDPILVARRLAADYPLRLASGGATVCLVQVGKPVLEATDGEAHSDDSLCAHRLDQR